MLQTKHTAVALAFIFCAGLFIQPTFAAAPTPAPAPAAAADEPAPAPERNWLTEALRSEKPADYYYRLLNDSTPDELEAEIEDAEHPEPPTPPTAPIDRPTTLEQKYQARLLILNGPITLSSDQKKHIKNELDNAKQELLDRNNAQYYKHLEHETYALIKERAPALFAEFQGKSLKNVLRMTAQFLLSLTKRKTYEEAVNEAQNPDLFEQSARASEEELPIARALGNILFGSIDAADKRKLKSFIQDTPPTDPAALDDLYLQDVLKEYIYILLCRRAGRECDTTKRDAAKSTDTTRSKDTTDIKTEPTTDGPDKKILETIDKVNEKLQNALYSLKKSKNFLGNVKAPDRATIKANIQRALTTNDTLKSAADAIASRYGQNMPSQYTKLVQTVQEIYKEASGF